MAAVHVNLERLNAELEQLATFSDAEPPAVTRVLFTVPDLAARAFLKGRFAETGLAVTEDPAGNLFARWEGTDSSLPAVATGSHTDAIPFSGRYDGTVGVLGGLEAIRALRASGWRPARSIELIMFTSEEPTRFGIGCLGSRLMSGAMDSQRAADLEDGEGKTFDEVRRQAGCIGPLEHVFLHRKQYSAFVELHIEQGPILERELIPIGVVTAIAAPASWWVEIDGKGGHAGTVLMPGRRDALCGAAEIILAVEAAAKQRGGPNTVATVGVCNVHPGAVNSIPSVVRLEMDVRDIDKEPRDRVLKEIKRAMEEILGKRGLGARLDTLINVPPACCTPEVIEAIQGACVELGFASKPMVSRAYHDTLFMARLAPVGMIFIPCRDGISHRPEEYTPPEAIGRGVEVLARTLMRLAANRPGATSP